MYERNSMETRSEMSGEGMKIRMDANIWRLANMENAKIEKHGLGKFSYNFWDFTHLEIYWKVGTK